MSYIIYAIIDPRSQCPFYVGETRAFARRCREHLDGTDQISGLIVRQIVENGFVPHFVVLESHDDEETALRAEIYWIETMLGRGIALVNSQAFSGFCERNAVRRTETARLDRMQRLRLVANGRKARRTPARRMPAGHTAPDPDPDTWQPAELKRLKGMQRHGLDARTMARMLGRPVKQVRHKLGANPKP